MSAFLLLVLLTAHWVADFVLQSNRMAIQKAKNPLVLAAHVIVYSNVVGAVFAFFAPTLDAALMFGAITAVTHFLTDAVTSRWTSKLWFVRSEPRLRHDGGRNPYDGRTVYIETVIYDDRKRHWFFVMIGFDQLIHVWTLALTAAWCLR